MSMLREYESWQKENESYSKCLDIVLINIDAADAAYIKRCIGRCHEKTIKANKEIERLKNDQR